MVTPVKWFNVKWKQKRGLDKTISWEEPDMFVPNLIKYGSSKSVQISEQIFKKYIFRKFLDFCFKLSSHYGKAYLSVLTNSYFYVKLFEIT